MLRFLNPVWYELQAIKKEDFSGQYEEENPEGYRIKIVGRGEQLFYQQDDKALLIEIVFAHDEVNIFTASIRKWDNGKKITEQEKKVILTRLEKYFVTIQKTKPIFVDEKGIAISI